MIYALGILLLSLIGFLGWKVYRKNLEINYLTDVTIEMSLRFKDHMDYRYRKGLEDAMGGSQLYTTTFRDLVHIREIIKHLPTGVWYQAQARLDGAFQKEIAKINEERTEELKRKTPVPRGVAIANTSGNNTVSFPIL
jgi:hypothetical protein